MSNPTRILSPVIAAGLAFVLPGETLFAQDVAAVRAKLSTGDYAGAVADATGVISASPAPDVLADARFLRAYARLADTIEKEGAALGRKFGARTATLDVFAHDSVFDFPSTVTYAKPGFAASYGRAGAAFTLPAGFSFTPSLSFKNKGSAPFDLVLFIESEGEWYLDVSQGAEEPFGTVSGYASFWAFDNIYDTNPFDDWFTYSPEFEDESPYQFVTLNPGQDIRFGLSPFEDDLRLEAAELPASIAVTATKPIMRSGLAFDLSADYHIPTPAVTFENKSGAPYELVLELDPTKRCGLNFSLWDGDDERSDYFYLPRDGSEEPAAPDSFFRYEAPRLRITIPAGNVLTVTNYQAAPGFRMAPIGVLPKTLLVKNGVYSTGIYPQFAKGSNTNAVFAALTRLSADAGALEAVVLDLEALPASHAMVLSAQESIHRVSTVVEKADVQTALALLKSAQAFGLLSRALDLGVDLSNSSLFAHPDPLAVFANTKTLLTSGKGSAVERARLRALLQEIIDHYTSALDAGLETRPTSTEGEFLFAGEGSEAAPLKIAAEAGGYHVTNQIYYDAGNVLAFRNTTAAPATLILQLSGLPEDPSYFDLYASSFEANVLLDDEYQAYFSVDAFSASVGSYTFDPETFDYTFQAYGVLDQESRTWTVDIPAGQMLKLELSVAAENLVLTPPGGLPAGVQVLIGESAIYETATRQLLADIKTSLSSPVPASRLLPGEGLPEGATLSFAPLFATKPLNLRATLPEYGPRGVRRGDSFRLLNSGVLGGLHIDTWESFLESGDDLDLVTPPKITPLKITRQPASVTLALGATHTLSVSAQGYPSPSYQWLKNGQVIEGETSASLVLAEVDGFDIGNYQVRVTGGGNTSSNPLLSAAAKVMVESAPVITVHPTLANTLFPARGNITLSVKAQGFGTLKYQWFKGEVALPSGKAATLTIAATTGATGTYRVKVSNTLGEAESETVSFTVLNIGTLPSLVALGYYQTLDVTIPVSGPGSAEVTYQWQKREMIDGVPVFGDIDQTDANFYIDAVSGSDAGIYRVIVKLGESTYTSPGMRVSVRTVLGGFEPNPSKDKSISFSGEQLTDTFYIAGPGILSLDDSTGETPTQYPYAYRVLDDRRAEITIGNIKAILVFQDDNLSGSFTATGTMRVYDYEEDKYVTQTVNDSGSFNISIEDRIDDGSGEEGGGFGEF